MTQSILDGNIFFKQYTFKDLFTVLEHKKNDVLDVDSLQDIDPPLKRNGGFLGDF